MGLSEQAVAENKGVFAKQSAWAGMAQWATGAMSVLLALSEGRMKGIPLKS